MTSAGLGQVKIRRKPKSPIKKPTTNEHVLDTSFLSGSASVVRDRGAVFDRLYVQACRLQCGDGAFATTARSFHADVHVSHSHLDRLFGNLLRGTLASKGSAFPTTFESASASTSPTQGVALGVSDRHRCIVERGIDVRDAHRDVTFDFSFFDLGHEFVCSGKVRLRKAVSRLGLMFQKDRRVLIAEKSTIANP